MFSPLITHRDLFLQILATIIDHSLRGCLVFLQRPEVVSSWRFLYVRDFLLCLSVPKEMCRKLEPFVTNSLEHRAGSSGTLQSHPEDVISTVL